MLLHQLISAAMRFFVTNEEFLVNNQSKPLAPSVSKYPVFLAGERGKLLALCIFG